MKKVYEMNPKRISDERELLLEEIGVYDMEKSIRVFLAIGLGSMVGSTISGIVSDVKTYVLFAVALMFVLISIYFKRFNRFSKEDLVKEFKREDLLKIDKYKKLSSREIDRVLGIRRVVLKEDRLELHKFNVIAEIKKRDIQEIAVKKGFIIIKADKKTPALDIFIPEEIFKDSDEKNIFLSKLNTIGKVEEKVEETKSIMSVFNIDIEKKREKLFKFFLLVQAIGLINMVFAINLQYGTINMIGIAYILSVLIPVVFFVATYVNMKKDKYDVCLKEDHIKIIGVGVTKYIRRFNEKVEMDDKYVYINTSEGKFGSEIKSFSSEEEVTKAIREFNMN